MAKKEENKKVNVSKDTLEEVVDHQKTSEDYLQTSRERWLDYESMLLGEHRETIQNENKIFDPRVSTIELERTSRVASQRPSGKAFAVSRDDTGKNMVMNLLLNYQMDNANEQWDFVVKQMMWSFWSRVYGTMYALTPWRVKNGYVGNELNIINIYDAFPQPSVSVQDAEWFTVGSRPSIQWLLKQDPEVWNMEEIHALRDELKNTEGDVKNTDNQSSYTQRAWYPNQQGDRAFPQVQVFTEYRADKWITWAKRTNTKKGREYLLRTVKNDDLEGRLPIVAKYAIPMFDGPQGLGPFQRGKSLQFGTNSLINMYMTTVKEKLRPQLMVDPTKAVMSSIKYDAGAYWYMQNPGKDIVPFNKGQEADATFNSAYGLMIAAMLNQAGTTDTTSPGYTESSLGKTPAAIQKQQASQGAQDYWEQVMMESAMSQVLERWIIQNTKNLDVATTLRLFEDEVEQIAEYYPDAIEMFDQSGKLTADKSMFQEDNEPVKFDYKIETGSMNKPSLDKDIEDVIEIINLIDEKPGLIAKMQQEGNEINATELFRQVIVKKGLREDKVIKQINPEEMQGAPQEVQQEVPQEVQQYDDPDINAVGQQLLGNIPPQ